MPRWFCAVEDAVVELDEDLECFLAPVDRLSSAGLREKLHDRPPSSDSRDPNAWAILEYSDKHCLSAGFGIL
ncbi:hypothetical protein [Rhodoglobus aureus]|uniref:Uncharacterized protein n=1 Tax=Rhodoglobus aureus TaxID=191497 RepID=A0ABP4G3B1_9MICO